MRSSRRHQSWQSVPVSIRVAHRTTLRIHRSSMPDSCRWNDKKYYVAPGAPEHYESIDILSRTYIDERDELFVLFFQEKILKRAKHISGATRGSCSWRRSSPGSSRTTSRRSDRPHGGAPSWTCSRRSWRRSRRRPSTRTTSSSRPQRWVVFVALVSLLYVSWSFLCVLTC